MNTDVCRLCGATANRAGQGVVLGRHTVAYFRCPTCDLIQTEKPYWLDAAYSEAISALDTGILARVDACRRFTLGLSAILALRGDAPGLDYGGGHGVFTRSMRDCGFDFYNHDKFAENIFARGFEHAPGRRYELVTCFEVFEHFTNPRDELDRVFALAPRVLLVGTVLHSGYRDDWWYLAREAGQHVAFYSQATMDFIGKRYGFSAVTLPGGQFTIFLRGDVASSRLQRLALQRLLGSPRLVRMLAYWSLRRSGLTPRIERDHLDRKNAVERDASDAASIGDVRARS